MIALRIVRSPVGAVLRAIRENPLRAAAVGHNIHGYKLTAFVIAAAYAGFAGGLLGVLQAFMPPDAFMFETSGQLVMQTAIGGRGTLFGPLVGAARLAVPAGLPAGDARASARPGSWCSAWCSCCWCASCASGIIGGLRRPLRAAGRQAPASRRARAEAAGAGAAAAPPSRRCAAARTRSADFAGPDPAGAAA